MGRRKRKKGPAYQVPKRAKDAPPPPTELWTPDNPGPRRRRYIGTIKVKDRPPEPRSQSKAIGIWGRTDYFDGRPVQGGVPGLGKRK